MRTKPRLTLDPELAPAGGLSIEEAAAAMGIPAATLKREWATARAWLQRELREGPGK